MSSTWKTLILLLLMMGVPLAVLNPIPATAPADPVGTGTHRTVRAIDVWVSPVTLRFMVSDPFVQLAAATPQLSPFRIFAFVTGGTGRAEAPRLTLRQAPAGIRLAWTGWRIAGLRASSTALVEFGHKLVAAASRADNDRSRDATDPFAACTDAVPDFSRFAPDFSRFAPDFSRFAPVVAAPGYGSRVAGWCVGFALGRVTPTGYLWSAAMYRRFG